MYVCVCVQSVWARATVRQPQSVQMSSHHFPAASMQLAYASDVMGTSFSRPPDSSDIVQGKDDMHKSKRLSKLRMFNGGVFGETHTHSCGLPVHALAHEHRTCATDMQNPTVWPRITHTQPVQHAHTNTHTQTYMCTHTHTHTKHTYKHTRRHIYTRREKERKKERERERYRESEEEAYRLGEHFYASYIIFPHCPP